MERKQSTLSANERQLISQIAADMQTGNHLLYPRSSEYKHISTSLSLALNKNQHERTEQENEMILYYNAVQSPELYKQYIQTYCLYNFCCAACEEINSCETGKKWAI